uniref:Protein phosphatase 1L n=1 Tax=Cyprinus carpio TaxID=7962 RepID=A0A8C1TM80_CYPCA
MLTNEFLQIEKCNVVSLFNMAIKYAYIIMQIQKKKKHWTLLSLLDVSCKVANKLLLYICHGEENQVTGLEKTMQSLYCVFALSGHCEPEDLHGHDAEDRCQSALQTVYFPHNRGHEAAADYVKAHLPEALKQQLQAYEREKKDSPLSYPSILEQRILAVDRDMVDKFSATHDEAGTTCLIALLSDRELTVANVGDSRGVLCDKDGNAVALSHDHKPYQLKERKRIKRAGGFISFNGSWRVQGILAMSRSLGDYPLKNLNVVIPDPDILTFDLDKLQPEFMILASDGLWDAFSNEEAVRFVRERLDEPHFGAKSIVLQSFYRGCPDNITVMVVKFKSSSGSKTGE